MDLAGNEADFFRFTIYQDISKTPKKKGMHITVHAGDGIRLRLLSKPLSSSVLTASDMEFALLDYPEAIALARQNGVSFEVCLTQQPTFRSSHIRSYNHPLQKMLDEGLTVTLNTDDPGISQINLSNEYVLALTELGMAYPVLRQCIMNSAHASFLGVDEKNISSSNHGK